MENHDDPSSVRLYSIITFIKSNSNNMKNQIIKLDEKNYKVFAFTDNKIILSTKGHHTMDSLHASVQKSGMLETIKTIPMEDVKDLFYNEKDDIFTFRYDKGGKTKSQSIKVAESDRRAPLVAQIGEIRSLQKYVEEESKTKPLLLNLLGLTGVGIFTWVCYGMAVDAENGEHYVATGRRSGIKQLLANLVEAIGPTGVLIIGVLGFAFMIYVALKRYKKPASEVTYK